MKKILVKSIISLMVLAWMAITIASPSGPARAAQPGTDAVLLWNNYMIRTVITNGKVPPPASFVYGAYAQAAVYNAVVAIEGGYQPYGGTLPANPGASVDAAVATAAHKVLVQYFPGQQIQLNEDYLAFMATLPDDASKAAGIETGNAAADQILALRSSDGLNADIGFSMPAPGPGVWQLPAGVPPLVPWMSKLKPFMLENPAQFRPGPPPDLSSKEWAKQYNEVLLYGHRDSTLRTADQTATARFWAPTPLPQFNLAYQQVAASKDLSAVETARLMVMGNMVGADALVGCFDAKYHYLFWRPAFAIPQGASDGNDGTVADPGFVPLLNTPPHPEYPSAHSCLTSAQAEMFASFLGTQHIEVWIPSTVTGVPARYYASANDLTREIINARVWAGIHYRISDEMGASLGRKVAHWTLKRYFLPE